MLRPDAFIVFGWECMNNSDNLESDNLEEDIFTEARHITNSDDRERFIQEACNGNNQLAHRVRSLLRVEAEEASFLETPLAVTSAMDLVEGVTETVESTIGPYELIEQIGAGGMGLVFLARQTTPVRRQVALKIIRPGMNTRSVIQRFEAERQTLAQLNHPGITRLLDAGTTATGRHWFVMELARGLPITDFCRQKSLSVPERLRLFDSVCEAMHHAHQNGVIHRDIKPSNIVVTNVNGQDVPKVIDFGVAKVTSQEMTCECDRRLVDDLPSATIVGTPAYMSPEQTSLPDHELDARCDVYALGMLLYELLTDTRPFQGIRWQDVDYAETRRIIEETSPLIPSEQVLLFCGAKETESALAATQDRADAGDPSPPAPSWSPRKLSAELKGDLDWITMKAIAKDRDRRYGSVAELAADIRRHLNHEPVEAGTPSLFYRLKKLVRRRRSRIAFTFLTLGLVLLLGISLVIGQLLSHARSESSKIQELVQEQQREGAEREIALRNHTYVSDFQAAFAAYLRGDLKQTERLLRQRTPGTQTDATIGFEWHYLNRLCCDKSQHLTGDKGKVFDVEYSPDGRLLASGTGSGDCSLQIWDAASGSLIHSIRDFESDVNSLCFSADGTLLLTGEEVGRIRAWDVATWHEVGRLEGFRLPIGQIHLAADNRTVIAAQVDWHTRKSTTTVRDLQTAEAETSLAGYRLLDVCSSGEIAALVSDDGEISLRKFPELELLRNLPGMLDGTCCGSFSNSGAMFACGGVKGGGRIWQLSDSKETTLPTHGSHPNGIRDISFSPDDQFLITASYDGIIEIRDVATQTIQMIFHSDHGESWSIGVAPNGSSFALGYQDGHLQIHQWKDIVRPRRSILQSPEPFHAVASSSDGTQLAIIDSGQIAVTVFATDDGRCLHRIAAPADDRFCGVSFSAEADQLWITDERGALLQADSATSEILRRDSIDTHPLMSPVWSPAEKYLAVSTDDPDRNLSAIWDKETASEVFRLPKRIIEGSFGPHRVCAFLSEDTVLTLQGRVLTRWNFRTGQEIQPRFQESGIWISHATPLPDNDIVAVGLFDGTVHLWDFASNQSRAILQGHQQCPTCITVSPDGQTLATASSSGEVRLWHLSTALPLCELPGLTGEVIHLWFAADGKHLYAAAQTASGGSEVMVWDATEP
jgi:serine/threonine protein kinase/WD40 repeat protein